MATTFVTIGLNLVIPEGTALIINYPSGVLYEAQCGGMMCLHNKYEGFAIQLGYLFDDFDDCSYGCDHIQDIKNQRDRLADDLNTMLITNTKKWKFNIRFDFDRITELQEGWWPVLISGVIDDWNGLQGEFRGIIHTGNCD